MKTEPAQARRLLWVLGLSMLGAGLAMGQTITGSLVGTIVDPGGLPVPGAVVTATATATQTMREAVTNERGDFFLGGVAAGNDVLTVHADDFKGS